MRNFVKGKPIPPTIEGNIVELLSPEEESEKQEEQKPEVAKTAKNDNSQNQDSNMQPPNYFAPNASKSVVRNPYDSRSTAASNVGTNKGQTDKPSSASSKPATSTSTVPSNHRQPLHSITAPPPKIATVFQRPPLRPKEMNLNSNNNRKGKTQRSRFSFIPKESQSYTPGPAPIHPETSTTWIYPQHKDFPIRQYQLEMSETAINYNTIVSLPTGLGKTLIAAVVLYNYYRWFPTGKLIFMAPTLPLVSQQAEACFDIMGIPEADTAILTGKIKAASRIELWKSRRVFFCTPQTVQKDLLSEESSSFASKVVCVVLDEAHKASGDYAYTKVISLLETASARFRIVGLSATPGTTIKAIQRVVDALRTVKIEARDEVGMLSYGNVSTKSAFY
jgi:Fanconi anemia group M protein